MFNFKKIAGSLRIFVRNGAKREIILFSKSNFAFSFKPFLAVQGLVIFLLFVAIASFFIPQSKFNQVAVVRTAITTKNTTIIANGGSVKWTTMVKQSDIKSGQYLLKLPRSATNIKITTINAKQAKAVLQAQPKEQLSLKQRQNLAIATQKKSKAGLFAKLSTFLFADLEQAASDAVQNLVETITQPKDPNITSTSDAMIVDLSQQSTQAPAETPTDESDSTEISVPAPAETTPTTCVSDSDCSSGQTCDNGSCVTIAPTIPAETPETPTETPTPTLAIINITPLTTNLTVGGATQQLTAETLDQNGAHIDAVITWSSDNTAVATVDDAGIVTPISAGAANITASSDSVTSAVPSAIIVSLTETTSPSKEPEIQKPAPKPVDATILSADIVSAQTIYNNAVVGTNTGEYAQSDKDTLQNAINAAIAVKDNSNSTQTNIDEADSALNTAIAAFNASSQYVQITYETPAPTISEQKTDTGKLVTVSAQYESPNQPQLTEVLAFTSIPKIYKVGDESKIHIKWKNNNDQDVTFHAYDTNGDGYLDYVEWTVPHLSDQIFEIIFISKAFILDQGQNIIEDIYDTVATKDNNWATVEAGQYVRYTFEHILDSTKDNTIYAKPANPSQPVTIEVYPVYTDQDGNQTEGPLVATFPAIDRENTYKVLLTNLQTPSDVFDMKIVGGSVDIDYIVDPTGSPTLMQEPASGSDTGYLQSTIIGTPNAATTTNNNLFDYFRKLELDKLNVSPSAVAEPADTDAGKLQDLLGTTAGLTLDRKTIFNFIYTIYTDLVHLTGPNIKRGITIGGLTGTYSGYPATGQTISYPIPGSIYNTNWAISTAYTLASKVKDTVDNSYWICNVAHTSGTGTMADDRAAHPTYWLLSSVDNFDDGYYKSGTVLDATIYSNIKQGSPLQIVAVNDSTTGLMWQKCSAGLSDTNEADNCTTGSAGTKSWLASIAYCENLVLCSNGAFSGSEATAGTCADPLTVVYNDWRLPNVKELFSIAKEDAGQTAPYINKTFFPNTVSAAYWSSTTYPNSTTAAFYVNFNYGYAFGNNETSAYYVRCVRGQ